MQLKQDTFLLRCSTLNYPTRKMVVGMGIEPMSTAPKAKIRIIAEVSLIWTYITCRPKLVICGIGSCGVPTSCKWQSRRELNPHFRRDKPAS